MRKIPTIFKRNIKNMSELLNEAHPDCQWVFDGEGVATRKYDGTCVLIKTDGSYFRRHEVKKGKKVPEGFVSISFDTNTGKTIGWVPVNPDNPSDKWHIDAFNPSLPGGTYELCGPKINGNPEALNTDQLIMHSTAKRFEDVPRNFEGIKLWLRDHDIEGLVFHHADGRMAKIKKRDFGLKRA